MRKISWLKVVALAVLFLLPLAATTPRRRQEALTRSFQLTGSKRTWTTKIWSSLICASWKSIRKVIFPAPLMYSTGRGPLKGALLNELPEADDLEDVISEAGIDENSLVVLVDKVEKVPDQFGMTRVAWTLKYAGVTNVAVLSGGLTRWIKEGKSLSKDVTNPKSKEFEANWNENLFVDKATVAAKLGKAIILDNRAPAFYEGKENGICR